MGNCLDMGKGFGRPSAKALPHYVEMERLAKSLPKSF